MNGNGISLSIQTFEKLRERQARYVDKTGILLDLIRSDGSAFFFSRPRRFGKSLTVTTLESIFQGKKELFEDLAISKTEYAWPIHPVIRLDMKWAAHPSFDRAELGLTRLLTGFIKEHDLDVADGLVEDLFKDLIESLHQKTGQKVVVLVDEYDKPLIDNLDHIPVAKEIQGMLKRFYGVLKSADEHLRFVFITGVSKFSRVSVFSDLNHLTDLTMDSRYATLVGMTEEELIENYSPYIQAIADTNQWSTEQVLEKIRFWYNGYRFSKSESRVYNPWSTLTLFNTKEFSPHWHVTGIPKMLIDIINKDIDGFAQRDPADFDYMPNFDIMKFDAYDIETLAQQLIPLMVQTGFLTIKDYDEEFNTYALGYPNWEVRSTFANMILDARLKASPDQDSFMMAKLIRKYLSLKDWDHFIDTLNRLVASIPGNLHTPKESYYHSLIHMVFQVSGLTIRSEEWVAGGRMDTVIEEHDCFYIIEFKFGKSAAEAIEQIKHRKYSAKFPKDLKPVYAIGISVDCASKGIQGWEMVLLA